MSRTATLRCDQCGKVALTDWLPDDWRQLVLQSVDGDVGSYSGDLCSPGCAGKWASVCFVADLRLVKR